MFYINAGFSRAFHAETIFTYDKELDDRPSDREIKCKPPADALYVDYEISPHSHLMSEDKNISLEIIQHVFLIQRYKV